jgi:hypothetical protein
MEKSRMKRILFSVAALASTLTIAPAASANTTSPAVLPGALAADPATSPNQVIVWNRILLAILRTPGAQPATIHPTRSLAMMHLAIADAIAVITRRFVPYHFRALASPHASRAAAAAQAAHDVLVSLYPAMQSSLDADLASSLMMVRNGAGKTAGIAIGARAARAILQLRADDGATAVPPTFVPGNAAGDYQLTPPAFAQPVFTHWPAVVPFVLRRSGQFRPGPPPALSSQKYLGALAEVKSLGEPNSLTRSPDQTQIGQFWSAPIQNYWNEIAQTTSLAHGDSIVEDARLFALLNTSFADDVIAFYDAKYTYRFWRPVTAINRDGLPADANWSPLVTTPPDPSYPGAHSVISFDGARILEHEFGDRFEFDVTSVALPGVVRRFSRFGAAAEEAGLSRIYAGDHFRFDHTFGLRLGRRVARYVTDHVLQRGPVRGARR